MYFFQTRAKAEFNSSNSVDFIWSRSDRIKGIKFLAGQTAPGQVKANYEKRILALERESSLEV